MRLLPRRARRRQPYRNRALAAARRVECFFGDVDAFKPAILHWHRHGVRSRTIADRASVSQQTVMRTIQNPAAWEQTVDVGGAGDRRPSRIYRAVAKADEASLSVLLIAAWNPRCPADLVAALATNPTYLVRETIACRNDLTDDLWLVLAQDQSSSVRAAVRTNKAATQEARTTAWMLGA